MYDWSDIRTFLAVMSEGSAAGAARRLGTNQTTVSRRIERLEAALSLRLFEAGARGARPTENALALLPEARAMEQAALALRNRADGLHRSLSGVIRITATPGVTRHFTGPLRRFQDLHPEVRFEIETGEDILSLEDGEADIAIRAAQTLRGDDLIARKLLDHPWGFYASHAYVERHGRPEGFEGMEGHRVVFYADSFAQRVSCVGEAQQRLGKGNESFRISSFETMVGLLLDGEGLGMLPRSVGDREPGLVFCFGGEGMSQRLWLVWSRQAEAAPHIGAFLRYCNGAVKDLLAGLPPEWFA